MSTKPMTHDELQQIEHINKVLEEHAEIVKRVVNDTESILNNYVPIVATYVQSLGQVQKEFGEIVANVIKSSRQLQIVTASVNEVMHFVNQVQTLDKVLTPELVEKLRRISKDA